MGRRMRIIERRKIETLYRLLQRAEEKKDQDVMAALRWAIFRLENGEDVWGAGEINEEGIGNVNQKPG